VSKIADKTVCRTVFVTIWHCILSAKTHSFRLFFGDFAYWVEFDDELYAYIRYVCTEFFAV